jgi:hypothetical protein
LDAAEPAGWRHGERDHTRAADAELLDSRLEYRFYRFFDLPLDVGRDLASSLDIGEGDRLATLVDFDPDHEGPPFGVRHSDQVFHDRLRVTRVWQVDEVLILGLTPGDDLSNVHTIGRSCNR